MLNLKLKHSNAIEVQSLLLASMLFPIEFLFINKKYSFLITRSDKQMSIAPNHVKTPFYHLDIKDICVMGSDCEVPSLIGVGTDSARCTDSCNWVLRSTVTDLYWW